MKMYFANRTWALLLVLALVTGCGTNVGNGLNPPPPAGVTLSFQKYSPQIGIEVMTLPSSVSQLTVCFKRLRFKAADGTIGDNVDLSLGRVTLNPNGTSLTSLIVPSGTYTRIEFDLDNHCSPAFSVQLTNSQGTFSTSDGMTIKFDGSIKVDGSSQSLGMSVQAIINALTGITQGTDIKNAAENASASF